MEPIDQTRRKFLGHVGQGMLVASLGSGFAHHLGISTAHAESGSQRLTFGKLEPLVSLMQETPVAKLQPLLVERLKKGDLGMRQWMQAAALANARVFGGEDYVGMHTLMAMSPAWEMARQLPDDRRALILLKILYRNTNQIQNRPNGNSEALDAVQPMALPDGRLTRDLLQNAVHNVEPQRAEQIFAAIANRSADSAFNDLLHVVEDETEVHRVVFAHRSWEVLDLVGMENAESMLRQSLRYCLNSERNRKNRTKLSKVRTLLPRLLDEFKLHEHSPGTSDPGDSWVEMMSRTIFQSTPEQAAEAVAAALADGVSPEIVGEAISLSTNQLVLRDAGRTSDQARTGKPEGSVHGDSIGVHASDSTAAWRGIARVSNRRNAAASLILAGYQAARDRVGRGGNFLEWKPRPYDEQVATIGTKNPKRLLGMLNGAIRENDQSKACALVHHYGSLGHEPRDVTDTLLRFATSEDGALHAEKYYLTATSDFATTRPAFRWRHLVGLARVTASEYGHSAPGYKEACELLGVEV